MSNRLEKVKIVMLKGEKGEKGDGSYNDTELRGLITAEAQSRASADNDLEMRKAEKTDVRSLADGLEAEISDINTDINVLDARMDTFASLPSGSTSGNAELLDIRVGADGFVFPSAGDAVREQIADTDEAINKVIKKPINLAKLSLVRQNATIETFSPGNHIGIVESDRYDLIMGIKVVANESYTLAPARAWAVLDKDNVILESSTTDHYDGSFTITPSHTGYLLIAYYQAMRGIYFVNKTADGDIYTSPSEYTPQEWLLDVLDDFTSDTFERVDTMIRDSYNLVKGNQITQGKALYGNDSIGSIYIEPYDNASYDTVIGVKAIAGQEYYVQSSRILYVVDENGTLLEKDNTSHDSLVEYTPTHDGFFAVTYKVENRGQFFINLKENGSSFEGYDAKYPMEWLADLIDSHIISPLHGKTIYNFGDSVSNGGTQTKGPAELVAEECGMVCNDYGVGGASMVNYQDVSGAEARSCIVKQIENAPSTAPDFVLLAGGINDLKFTTAGNAPSQPTSYLDYGETYINNLDITKFAGAFEKAIYTVISKYPTAQLIYMFEQKMFSHLDDGTQNLHDVAMNICKKWNVPVLDMWDNGGLNLAIIPHLIRYGSIIQEGGYVIDGVHYDGTHPNDLGYKTFYVPKLKAKLIECCKTMDVE